jgi:hypothetical protein
MLRRSKGFERGGVEIDVYELRKPTTASSLRGGDPTH